MANDAVKYEIIYLDGISIYRCGSCGVFVDMNDKYCRECGKRFAYTKEKHVDQ